MLFARRRHPRHVRFAGWREGFFASVDKLLLGLDDIRVGDPDFDAEFAVTPNHPDRARRLFSDAELGRPSHILGGFGMVVRDRVHRAGKDFRHGIDDLVYLTPGVVRGSGRARVTWDVESDEGAMGWLLAPQNSACPGVRGNGMTSRMFAIPVA